MNQAKRLIRKACLLSLVFLCVSTQAQEKKIPFSMPAYYENSSPKARHKTELLTADVTHLQSLADSIKKNIDHIDVESLCVLSMRLYDLGKKDEAFYWFHTAKSRGIILLNMLNPASRANPSTEAYKINQFLVSFFQVAGEYINGYGFNDIDKAIRGLQKIRNEINEIHTYKDLYTQVNFINNNNFAGIKTNEQKDLDKMISYLAANKKAVEQARKKNGIQDKY